MRSSKPPATLITFSNGIVTENALPHEIRLVGQAADGEHRKATLLHYPASSTELRLGSQTTKAAERISLQPEELRLHAAGSQQAGAVFSNAEEKLRQRFFIGTLSDSGGVFFREYSFGKGSRAKKATIEIIASLRGGELVLNAQHSFSKLSRKQNALIQADIYNAFSAVADGFLTKVRRISASPSMQVNVAPLLSKAPDQGASLRGVRRHEIVRSWPHATRSKPEAYLSYAVPKGQDLPEGADVRLLLSTDSRTHACTVVTLPRENTLSVPQAFRAALDLLHYRSPYTAWFNPASPTLRDAFTDYVRSFSSFGLRKRR